MTDLSPLLNIGVIFATLRASGKEAVLMEWFIRVARVGEIRSTVDFMIEIGIWSGPEEELFFIFIMILRISLASVGKTAMESLILCLLLEEGWLLTTGMFSASLGPNSEKYLLKAVIIACFYL